MSKKCVCILHPLFCRTCCLSDTHPRACVVDTPTCTAISSFVSLLLVTGWLEYSRKGGWKASSPLHNRVSLAPVRGISGLLSTIISEVKGLVQGQWEMWGPEGDQMLRNRKWRITRGFLSGRVDQMERIFFYDNLGWHTKDTAGMREQWQETQASSKHREYQQQHKKNGSILLLWQKTTKEFWKVIG